MADENSSEQIINTINDNTNLSMMQVEESGNNIVNAINDLGKGLKLNPAKNPEGDEKEKKKEPSEIETKLFDYLKTCSSFNEMFGPFLESLNTVKTEEDKNHTVQEGDQEESEVDAYKEAANPAVPDTLSSLKEISAQVSLAGIISAGFITGTNVLLNALNEIKGVLEDNFQKKADSGAIPVEDAPGKPKKENKNKDKGEKLDGGGFSAYLSKLAGPLESIAQGVLLLAAAITILALAFNFFGPENVIMAGITMLGIMVFLTLTILAVTAIGNKFRGSDLETDKNGKPKKEGSIFDLAKSIALLMVAFAVTAFIIESKSETISRGLVKAFAILLVVSAFVVGLAVLANLALSKIPADTLNAFTNLLKRITTMLLFISVLVVILGFINTGTIAKGMVNMFFIMMLIHVFILLPLVGILQLAKGLDAKALQGLSLILREITVMIAIVSLMVIILGFIGPSIIMSGIISMFLILVLIDVSILALTTILKKFGDLNPAVLKALQLFLGEFIIMVLVVSILVIILSSMDTGSLIKGILAMTLIVAIPVIAITLLAKVAKTMKTSFAQAMLAIGIIGLFVAAIAFLLWLLAFILNPAIDKVGGTPNLVKIVMAIAITTGLFVLIGLAMVALGAMGTAVAAVVPFVLLGLAVMAVLIAAVAVTITLMVSPEKGIDVEKAQKAMVIALAMATIVTSFSIIAAGIIQIAKLSVKLALAKTKAINALDTINSLIGDISEKAAQMGKTINEKGVDTESLTADIEKFGTLCITLQKTIASLIPPLLSFSKQGLMAVRAFTAAVKPLTKIAEKLKSFNLTLKDLQKSLTGMPDISPLIGEGSAFAKSLENLQTVNKTLNGFEKVDKNKIKAANQALNFVKDFSKKLSGLDDGVSTKVDKLTKSLSELAQTSDGLINVANAMRNLQQSIASFNPENLSTIEKIAGSTVAFKLTAQIEKAASDARKENKPAGPDLTQLWASLRKIESILTQMTASMQYSAETARRANESKSNEPAFA